MATAECRFGGGMNSNTGDELKLKNSLIRITVDLHLPWYFELKLKWLIRLSNMFSEFK